MKIFLVTVAYTDYYGNLGGVSQVFTSAQEALNRVEQIHEEYKVSFAGCNTDDTYQLGDRSFEFTVFDGDNEYGEIEFQKSVCIQELEINIPEPPAKSAGGTQVRMMTLKEFVDESGLSGAELARQLDCSKSRVCGYLRGESIPTKAFRNLIRNKFNVELID